MADSALWRLPTSWLAVICVTLLAALFTDRWWQSTDRQHSATIHPLPQNPTIELSAEGQLAMSFQHRNGSWQLTTPLRAPANQRVVEQLLASNRYTSRSYPLDEIPTIAHEPTRARLGIDGHWLEFKSIEPVSGLRYVVANDRIYLQPDRVVPLLQAGVQFALDRRLATVCGSADDACNPIAIEATQLIAHRPDEPAAGEIDVLLANGKKQSYTLYTTGRQIALHRRGTQFRYVLPTESAEQLGLSPPPI